MHAQNALFAATVGLVALTVAQPAQAEQSYLFGEPQPWGITLKPEADTPLKLRLGTRLQTAMSMTRLTPEEGASTDAYDAYARRVRFQVKAQYERNVSFYMDVRNDNADQEDRGTGGFEVGDAFVMVHHLAGVNWLNLKAFRAKVDVSRSSTVSSSALLHLFRADVVEAASDYVSAARRATNVQAVGQAGGVIAYQLIVGDGVQSGDFEDARGQSADTIRRQQFMVGGRLRLSPIPGWGEEKPAEVWFGQGRHFTLGGGAFTTGGIEYAAGAQTGQVRRTLYTIEASAHWRWFGFQAEAFEFRGVVEDFGASDPAMGTGRGGYVQGQVFIGEGINTQLFGRFERSDRFREGEGYDTRSGVVGLNWFLKGHQARLGVSALRRVQGAALGGGEVDELMWSTMWHY